MASACPCRYLAALADRLHDYTVVELGCGTALTGLFAARHAARVVLTDADDDILRLASESARLNAGVCRAPPRIANLPWGGQYAE